MKLYVNPLSANCRKVTAVAKHLGLDADQQVVDLARGEHKKPEFLAINPNGKVPALTDGDTRLWESNAIMGYLCSKVASTDLWPKSNARYDILRWMFWELAHWGPATDTFVGENLLKKAFGGGDPDQAALEKAAGDAQRYGRVLDDHLDGRRYLTGDRITLADFAVASHLTYAAPAKIPLDGFRRIAAWSAALDEIPAWRDTAPKMDG